MGYSEGWDAGAINMRSLSDLPFYFLELLADVFEEVLEILFLGVELFELALDTGVLALVVGEVSLAVWGQGYSY